MSKFRPVKCPSCGGELQLPEDKDVVSCMYCGTKIIVKDVLGGADSVKKENLLKLADNAKENGNYQEALDYYNKYLEIDIKSKNAWFGKAETTALSSTCENLRILESVKCFDKIIELFAEEEKEKVSLEIYEKIREILKKLKSKFLSLDRNYLLNNPQIHQVKLNFQENSVKFILAYKEIEKHYDEDIDFTEEVLDLIKLINANRYKFPKNVRVNSAFIKEKTKTSFNKFISKQKSFYQRKLIYLNKLNLWKKSGQQGPQPKMPRFTSKILIQAGVIIGVIILLGICTFLSCLINNCQNRNKRPQELRELAIQDSIRQAEIEDSIKQQELQQAFLDSLEIHNPDSFAILMKLDILKQDSIEQQQIQDSLEQFRIEDSIAELLSQDSVDQGRRFRSLKSRMRIDDEDPEVIWVYHHNSPVYVNSRRHMCYPYMGLKSHQDRWLMLRIGYNLSDWLFLENIIIEVDGQEYIYAFNSSAVNQDPTGNGVSEWVDISGQESLIRKIAYASEVWIFYQGSEGEDSYQLSSFDLKSFQEIVEIYDLCSLRRFASDLR
ncbi:MAG: hypothetical protein ACP5FK_07295 [bacterium]